MTARESASATSMTSVAAPPQSSESTGVSASPGTGGGRGDGSGGGQRGKRFGDAPVYIDGQPVGILRYLELPERLVPHDHELLDGRKVPRFRLVEYLEAVGVDLTTVNEVHLVGGRNRTSILKGAALRAHRTDLTFSFTKETGGKARVHWPGSGIEVNTTIDTIVSLSVYVKKAPPRYDPESHKLFYADGSVVEGIPYASPEASLRGTRVYVDSRLVGAVKRKRIVDGALSPRYTTTDPLYSLVRYLGSVGVDVSKLRSFTALQGDHVVLKVDESTWKKAGEDVDFSLTPGSEGRIVLHRTSGLLPASSPTLTVSALVFHTRSQLPKRLAEAAVEVPPAGSPEPQANPDDANP
ncbi:MAG: hypothetical protein U0271_19530 [Polyangiaceae bacterium]